LLVSKHYILKTYGRVDVLIHVFLTSALAGGEWPASRPCHFPPPGGEKFPGTNWIGGKVDPRVSLDCTKKYKFLTLPGLELRPLCRLGRSHSLCWLHYRGDRMHTIKINIVFVWNLLLYKTNLGHFSARTCELKLLQFKNM
jgi:hypothetical protein